jgi:hypothetical protein
LLRATWLTVTVAATLVTTTRLIGQAPPPPQPPLQLVSPFDMVGFIQKATLDNPADVFSGGSMTINGHVVTVPTHTILQMPASALTWQEVFALAPSPYGIPLGPNRNGQSGLALTDSPPPLATYEVRVQGNRVGDQYIAGLIFLAQQSLNVGQGFINYIDYAKGELRIGGTLNDRNSGARVRINDPLAKFSKGDSPDRRFTIDEDNPTVRAQTGFPLCIPRTDPAAADDAACPQGNRPRDVNNQFVSILTYPPPAPGVLPDPRLPAPFEIGDYVNYSGTLAADPSVSGFPTVGPYPPSANSPSAPLGPNDTYVSANTVIANLGFFTTSNTSPVYVGIDVMLMGTGGLNTSGFPQEATLRTRVEGFTTDPYGASGRSTVNIYAIDVDPCTGATTDRLWVSGVAVDIGPPTGAVKGRWRFRPTGGLFLPPARNLRATMGDGRGFAPRKVTQIINGMGLETGQYNAPIFQFIFPENLGVGNPPVPMNLVDFPFLANGSGPYFGAVPASPPTSLGIVGQLSPWPGSPAPSPVICGPSGQVQLPVATAFASPTAANSGDVVTLDASGSSDPNTPAALSFAWSESGTPNGTAPVTLAPTANPAVVTFVAPSVTQQTTLSFNVAVTNVAGTTTASVSVAVSPLAAPTVTAASAPNPAAAGATVTLTATSSSPGVTYKWTQMSGSPSVTLSSATSRAPTFQAPVLTLGAASISLGFQVTATNSGGSATATTSVTVNPPPDIVTITTVVYRFAKSRLDVTATTSAPIRINAKTGALVSPILTLSFFDAASGKTVSSSAWFMVNGVPTITVIGFSPPASVTVTSSFGGTATSPILTFR